MLTIVDFLKGEVMKRFLCLKDHESTFDGDTLESGRLYDSKYLRGRDWVIERLVDKSILKPVEVFERDGLEWILNKGEQLVPYGWLIDVMTGNGCVDESEECSSEWSWKTQHTDGTNDYCIYAIRIISTGEQEAPTDVVEQEESEESNIQNWSKVQARDWRDPSPQEAAYAAKVAAMEPKPEAPKTFPALRDIDYNPRLLGAGQYLKGVE